MSAVPLFGRVLFRVPSNVYEASSPCFTNAFPLFLLIMSSNRSRSNSAANNRSYSPNVPRHTPNRRRRGAVQQQAQLPNGGYSPSVTPARPVKMAPQPAATPEPSTSFSDSVMSPNSKYTKNLNFLRRKDAHITSIFDQFAHVTLYYLDEDAGGKYERAGFEGVMFFVER